MLIFLGCKKDEAPLEGINLAKQGCGSSDMLWLSDLIAKADEDKASMKYSGAYLGTIYMTTYKNNNVFMITMMLNSGGVMFHAYDCNHQVVQLTENEAVTFYSQTLKNGKVVYTNFP